ncbi:MAG: hypothetical protein R2851_07420 [Caldilineaceae bacterium]
MTGYTDEVEKALFLRRFGVPGADRLRTQRRLLVQHDWPLWSLCDRRTVVKDSEQLPPACWPMKNTCISTARKAHRHDGGRRLCAGCIAGSPPTKALTQAYGRFKDEARRKPDYQPQTVNTDGWFATQNAWQALLPPSS